MTIGTLTKYAFVVYMFTVSPLISIVSLIYIIDNDKKIKSMKNQIRVANLEDNDKSKEDSILTNNLEDVLVMGNVSYIKDYKTCTIVVYKDRFCRIAMPSGAYLPKIFLRLEDAKREIDMVAPMFVPTTREKSRIYNVRYVK